tara:strand:+ start:87 stop:965 length:879 start_codon:yes stop_codon:yes gene_type:complete
MVNWKSKYLKYKLKFEKLNQKGGMNGISQDVIERAFMNDLYNNFENIMTMSSDLLAQNGLTYENRMIALEMSKYYKELVEREVHPYITELINLKKLVITGLRQDEDLVSHWSNDELNPMPYRLLRMRTFNAEDEQNRNKILQAYTTANNALKRLEEEHPIFMRHPLPDDHMYKTFLVNYFQYFALGPGGSINFFQNREFPNGMNFEGANLSNANFSYSKLSGVNFNNTNLSSASFSNSRIINCDFIGANLNNTNWLEVEFEGINFEGASTEGSNIEEQLVNWLVDDLRRWST